MYLNVAHYFFAQIAAPEDVRDRLQRRLEGTSVKGTILIAPEGTNCNLAGAEEDLLPFLNEYFASLGCKDFRYRKSYTEKPPYRLLKIRAKKEIITMGVTDLDVASLRSEHISPAEFRDLLKDPGETLILDTRNDFEVEMGTFRGAQNPNMRSFRDFPQIAAGLDPAKPIVMFCTGGIRCEKASAFLRSRGFEHVRQLDGGILQYLNEYGKENFRGDCFVFDERVAYPVTVESENGGAVASSESSASE